MVKVLGACDKPFWIYKRLNSCAAPAPDSDDVLVVEEEVFYVQGMPRKLPLKRPPCPAQGQRNYSIAYISKTASRMHLGPSPFDSAPRTLRGVKLSFLGTNQIQSVSDRFTGTTGQSPLHGFKHSSLLALTWYIYIIFGV